MDSAASTWPSWLRDHWTPSGAVVVTGPTGCGRSTMLRDLVSGAAPLVRLLGAPHPTLDVVDLWSDLCGASLDLPDLQGLVNVDLRPEAPDFLAAAIAANLPAGTVIAVDDLEFHAPVVAEVWARLVPVADLGLLCTVGQGPNAEALLGTLQAAGAHVVPLPTRDPAQRRALVAKICAAEESALDPRLLARIEDSHGDLHLLALAAQSVVLGGSGDPGVALGELLQSLPLEARTLVVVCAVVEEIGPPTLRRPDLGVPVDSATRLALVLSSTGLSRTAAQRALQLLIRLHICDSSGRILAPIWRDAAWHLLPASTIDQVIERVLTAAGAEGIGSVRIAELMARRAILSVADFDIVAEAADRLLSTRADTALRWITRLEQIEGLDSTRLDELNALGIRARAARADVDLRSRVAASVLASVHSPGQDSVGSARRTAFSKVMAGNLPAAQQIYAEIDDDSHGPAADPEVTLERAAIAALAADWELCRTLAATAAAPAMSSRVRLGGMSLSLLVETMTGFWLVADSWARALEEQLCDFDPAADPSVLAYLPWLHLGLYKTYQNDLTGARQALRLGITQIEQHGDPWMLPAHLGLAAQVELRAGHLAPAQELADRALSGGPDADGLGSAGWAFGVLMWAQYLTAQDDTEVIERWSQWRAPVALLGVEQPWLRLAVRHIASGRMELGRTLLLDRWREARASHLVTALVDLAPWVTEAAFLLGDLQLLEAVRDEMGHLALRSGGRSPGVQWAAAFADSCLSRNPAGAQAAVDAIDAERLPVLVAGAAAHMAWLWSVLGESAAVRPMQDSAIALWNRIGAQGRARQFAQIRL